MVKRLLNSIYTRFLAIFISALFLANIVSAITVYYTKIDDIKTLMKEDLAYKVNLLHFLIVDKKYVSNG